MRLEDLNAPMEAPGQQRLESIRRLVTSSLEPVRPLPSDRSMILALLLLFTAFCLIATIPVGFFGFRALSATQRVVLYPLIAVSAASFSASIVEQMIPGAKRRLNPAWLVVLAPFSLAAVTLMLFRDFNVSRFVPLGVPCLRLGLICALNSTAVLYWIVRMGAFTSPVQAGATVGFFAGLAGVAVLALHCPILNAPHVLVWHLGAMVLAGAAGTVIGVLRQ